MYDSSKIELPRNFLPKHPFDNGELIIRDEKLAATPRVLQEINNHICDYYAMMTHLDAQSGNIINALKEKDQLENTMIIYAGDNGLALGKHGLMGKQNVYEHSIKVPLIFSGPGIRKDYRASGSVYLIDIFSTVSNQLGIPVPATVQVQAVLCKNAKTRISTLHIYKDFQKAVHKDHYQLIEYDVKAQRHTQLFKDPYEIHNLAAIKKDDKKLREMRDLLDAEIRKAKERISGLLLFGLQFVYLCHF
jgi:arylsulfatase A-like enzyme